MKISAVSKIISRIQFTIYSLFVFFISSTVIAYILLSNGISISHINLPNFKVDQLYIKLDKKLTLHVKKIYVTLRNNSNNTSSKGIYSFLKFARTNFHSLIIEELVVNKQKVTFSYKEHPTTNTDNQLSLVNETIALNIDYAIYDDYATIDLHKTTHKSGNVSLKAKAVLDLNKNTLHAVLSASAKGSEDLKLFIKENGTALAFASNSPKVGDLASIVNLFALEKSTSKWIVDYNQAKDHQLLQAQGVYEYNNADTIRTTLFIKAREANAAYTFNQDLSPLHANYIDVYYSKGILHIRPNSLSYNKHSIDSGSVNIDFNTEHPMLNIDLHADITISQDVIDIVNAYDISLPLLQKNGSTASHLNIDIDLVSEKATASGEFYIKDSELKLYSTNYKIKDAQLSFNSDYLRLKKAQLNYEDMLYSDVNGLLDLQNFEGNFFFDINRVDLDNSVLKGLKLLDKNLRMHLNLSGGAENYILAKSNWSYKDYEIAATAAKVTLPKKSATQGHIKSLKLRIPQLADVDINGTIGHGKANLNINLKGLNYKSKDVKLSSDKDILPLLLSYEQNITQLHLASKSSFKLNDMQLNIMPTSALIKDGYIDLEDARIELKNTFSSQISAHYKLGSNDARLNLKDTKFFTGKYLYIKPKFTLFYAYKESKHNFHINKYNMHATIYDKDVFALNIKDISKLYPHSQLMQRYDLKSGSANLVFMGDKTDMIISLKDFHPLLSKDGKDITEYSIEGTYKDNVSNVRINNSLNLVYNKKGKLTADNIDFNLFPILSYLKYIDTNDEKSTLDLSVETKNCNVSLGYSKRKILADSIKINITPSDIKAKLVHKDGGIMFQSHNDEFTVYGNGLNDNFMNEIFKFSRFKGGELSFLMHGRFDEFDGFIKANNTIMKDYTVLNNILAFFNTIPSLVTFSIPGYSSQGIKAQEIYATFHKKDNKLFIEEAKITSKELVINAKGESDFEKETIDAIIDVKTDIGSSAKEIPLVGYIIFGEDTVSTSVRVRGDLKDPKVESASGIAESIYTAPYNIIKRTLTLPLKFFDFFDDEDKKKE